MKSNIDEKGEFKIPEKFPASLNNLGTDDPRHPSICTMDISFDLAVIPLEREETKDFGKELLDLGFEPISSEVISDEHINEGSDIFTVGFPGSFTTYKLEKFTEWSHKLSPYVSFPNFSFGKVSMSQDYLDFFWADISISPGNSGGPVVKDNKLVGIISGQATETIKITDSIHPETGIPFAKIINAGNLPILLARQEEKDRIFYFSKELGN